MDSEIFSVFVVGVLFTLILAAMLCVVKIYQPLGVDKNVKWHLTESECVLAESRNCEIKYMVIWVKE